MTSKEELAQALAHYADKKTQTADAQKAYVTRMQKTIHDEFKQIESWLSGIKGLVVIRLPSSEAIEGEEGNRYKLEALHVRFADQEVTFTPVIMGQNVDFQVKGLAASEKIVLKHWGDELQIYSNDVAQGELTEGYLLYKLKLLVP